VISTPVERHHCESWNGPALPNACTDPQICEMQAVVIGAL
jgi:hypothetical protein